MIRVNFCYDHVTAEYEFGGKKTCLLPTQHLPNHCIIADVVTVYCYLSYHCKLGMQILQGNMNGLTYRDLVRRNIVVPDFVVTHLLKDDARPHRARIVTE